MANKNETAGLTVVLKLLDELRDINPKMVIGHAYACFLVAEKEGLGVNEYAMRAGVAQSVMTRWLLDIGSHNRRREPGLGLVIQRQDPMNLRRHQTFLTSKGNGLVHRVLRTLSAN